MPWKPRYRCPCCGRLATAYALGHSGTHRLEERQCERLPGPSGFRWTASPLPADVAGGLVRGLAKAITQVLRLVTPPADLLGMALPDLEEAIAYVRAARAAASYAPASYAPASYAPASYAPASYAPASYAPASYKPDRVTSRLLRLEEEEA